MRRSQKARLHRVAFPRVLPWAGFAPLRPGCIHVFCPRCHRKFSNSPLGKFDPPRATLVHTFCERCGQGGKDSPESFYAADGQQIPWDEIERQIARVVDDEAASRA
jgi:hypothetical protein